MADARPGGDDAVGTDAAASAAASSRSPSTAVIDANAIVTNRKAYLLSLVPDLTLDEVWMLQERLANLDLRTDIFARLPPELQIMVADCLGPADLGCCLHVSCMWRGSFLNESLRKDLARRCFPSLLEYVDAARARMAKSNTDTNDIDDTDHNDLMVDQIFAETARKYALRALGRFRYVFRHCRSPPFSVTQKASGKSAGKSAGELTTFESTWLDQGRPLSRRQKRRQLSQHQHQVQQDQGAAQYAWQPPRPYDTYSNKIDPALETDSEEEEGDDDLIDSFNSCEYAYGRLSWQCLRDNDTWFLVDDLRNGRRLLLRVPNDRRRGEAFLLVGCGDEVLIAASGSRMLAWNFVTGEQQTKQLPAPMDTVQTLGKRICILADGHVYFWKFGGMLQDINMTGLDEKHLEPDVDGRLPSYFILDPINEDVFYLGNFELDVGQMGRNGKLGFHLHMFEGLKYKETVSDYINFDNYAFPLCLIEATVRRNARGLYSLASWRSGSGAPGPTRNVSAAEVEGVSSLAFNMYTKTFSMSFFSLPPVTPSYSRENNQLIRIHIWNDQLITIVDRFRETPNGKVRRAKPLLFAFDDEYSEAARCSEERPFSAVPLYTSKLQQDGEPDRSGSDGVDASGAEDTHIMPEFRQKVRFDELSPGTPGQWLQDDDDWTKNKCLLRFALDIDSSPSRTDPYRPAHIGSYFMQGDDDFFVFRHGNEYTIWSFRDDIVHSVSPDAADGAGASSGAASGESSGAS